MASRKQWLLGLWHAGAQQNLFTAAPHGRLPGRPSFHTHALRPEKWRWSCLRLPEGVASSPCAVTKYPRGPVCTGTLRGYWLQHQELGGDSVVQAEGRAPTGPHGIRNWQGKAHPSPKVGPLVPSARSC